MFNISKGDIEKFAVGLVLLVFFLLSVTTLWLIILRYISITYLQNAESSQSFVIWLDFFGTLITGILYVGLLVLYYDMSRVQKDQAEILGKQQKIMEAEYDPDIRVIDVDGVDDFVGIKVSNERGGIAVNLTVLTYISTGEQPSHTEMDDERGYVLVESGDGGVGVVAMFEGLRLVEGARGPDEATAHQIAGASIHPTGKTKRFTAEPELRLVIEGQREMKTSYSEVCHRLLEREEVNEVGMYTYLCYRDIFGVIETQFLAANQPIKEDDIEEVVPIKRGRKTEPDGLEYRVRQAYSSWLSETIGVNSDGK